MTDQQMTPTKLADRVRDDGVPNPVMHHVSLKTTRLPVLLDFYEAIVGMQPNFLADDVAFLTNDGANHRLAVVGVPGLRDDPEKIAHTGMHHIAFEFNSLDELLTRYRTLAELDIYPHLCLDHGPMISFYYLDPDRNLVEMQADNFDDWAASAQLMRTSSQFKENPIGTPVDAAKLAAAAQEGLSAAELHERAWRGDYPPDGPVDYMFPETA